MDQTFETLINRQFENLSQKYTELVLVKDSGLFYIRGSLLFSAEHNQTAETDCFDVELRITKLFPKDPPTVKETGGRIPKDFHINEDGTLCLGARLGINIKFSTNPTLFGFVEDHVIPYLFSFSYKEKHGEMPFGELSHGLKGTYEYYQGLFKQKNSRVVLDFLKLLAFDEYRGHLSCPCESGRRLRYCHGGEILALKKYQTTNEFFIDFFQIILYLKEVDVNLIKGYLGKTLERKVKNRFLKMKNNRRN